jgi:hypothetical protein
MRTIKDDRKRKTFFDMVINNHIAGYSDIVKYQINSFSKLDLIRFTNYLRWFIPRLYIDINGKYQFDLFEVTTL